MEDMKGCLDGVRVIEWAAYHVGAHGATLLGDLGAEVIKIEERTAGDPTRGANRLGGIPVKKAEDDGLPGKL